MQFLIGISWEMTQNWDKFPLRRVPFETLKAPWLKFENYLRSYRTLKHILAILGDLSAYSGESIRAKDFRTAPSGADCKKISSLRPMDWSGAWEKAWDVMADCSKLVAEVLPRCLDTLQTIPDAADKEMQQALQATFVHCWLAWFGFSLSRQNGPEQLPDAPWGSACITSRNTGVDATFEVVKSIQNLTLITNAEPKILHLWLGWEYSLKLSRSKLHDAPG